MLALSTNEGNWAAVTHGVQQASHFTGNLRINYKVMITFSKPLLLETLEQDRGEKTGIKFGPELEGRNKTVIRWQADAEALL